MATDPTYDSKVYRTPDRLVVADGGYILRSVGTVAAAGSTQADAAPITCELTVVTGADGTKGVILPTFEPGMQITLKNGAASALKVYPPTGAAINALSANAAMSIAANTCPTFHVTSATQAYTNPLLPS